MIFGSQAQTLFFTVTALMRISRKVQEAAERDSPLTECMMLLMKLMKETMRNMVKVMSTQEATCKEKKLNNLIFFLMGFYD